MNNTWSSFLMTLPLAREAHLHLMTLISPMREAAARRGLWGTRRWGCAALQDRLLLSPAWNPG